MLGISRASYYKWLHRKPAQYENRDQSLMTMMLETYNALDGIYGYRRMTIYLNHFRQAKVNHKHVYRLMKMMNLKSVIRRKKRRYKTVKPDYIAANILNREFHAAKPMQKLVTDITEFSTTDGR
ncbi:helix-turn-helix protein, partial [Jeotgalicoccus halotolerans]